jgi:hypothetical protein
MVVFIAVPPTDFSGLDYSLLCLNIVFCRFLPQELPRTGAASAAASASPRPFLRRSAEAVAQFFQVIGADPLKVLIYGRIAIDATPHLPSAIVDGDVGEHNLLAR